MSELRKRWIARLRKGDIKQGYGRLRRDNGACCALGVACVEADAFKQHNHVQYKGEPCGDTWLPLPLLKDLSITDQQATDITIQNDQHRLTFPQLADYIEALPLAG